MNIVQNISLREEGRVKGGGCYGRFVRNPGEGVAQFLIIIPIVDIPRRIADRSGYDGCDKADGTNGNGGS